MNIPGSEIPIQEVPAGQSIWVGISGRENRKLVVWLHRAAFFEREQDQRRTIQRDAEMTLMDELGLGSKDYFIKHNNPTYVGFAFPSHDGGCANAISAYNYLNIRFLDAPIPA